MSNGTRSARWREWVAAGLLAATVGGGWFFTGDDPAVQLHDEIQTNTLDRFEKAKELLFNEIDRSPGDSLRCVYSGTMVPLAGAEGERKPPREVGVDIEHTWACNADWVEPSYHFDREESVAGADLHNLYPARAGPNRSRGNHAFGDLPADARELWIKDNGFLARAGRGTATGSYRDENCLGTVIFEPRDDHKGNVARSMFYMSVRYGMPIPAVMERTLRTWNELDPVDDAERDRNTRIERAQGNRNPFVDDPEFVELIEDF
jgi:hypothetical protein